MAGRVLESGDFVGGRYRVVRFLAKGGMASVYEVEHRLTEKRLALKILHPHILDNRAARDSFEFEAKVAARVDSEHVVQVHDAGVELLDDQEAPYLVMELLEGETLEQRSQREGPLSTKAIVPWLEQIAAGLDAAHQHRNSEGELQPIIHRDLKPENIFLHRSSTSVETVKILDFGIAKLVTRSAQTSQVIRGTPLYIAFEQLTGRRVSHATDIWSLGLITFTLLAGCSYWLSASRKDARPESLFAEIVTLPLEPPSTRLRALGLSAALHPGFDAWFLRCINRDPGKRFTSAGSAVRALVAVLDQQPLVIHEGSAEAPAPSDATPASSSALPASTVPSSMPAPRAVEDLASDWVPPSVAHSTTPSEVPGTTTALPGPPLGESHPAVSSGRSALHERPSTRARWLILALVLTGAIAGAGLHQYRSQSLGQAVSAPTEPASERAAAPKATPATANPANAGNPAPGPTSSGAAAIASGPAPTTPTNSPQSEAPKAYRRSSEPRVVPSLTAPKDVGAIAPSTSPPASTSSPRASARSPSNKKAPMDAYSTY